MFIFFCNRIQNIKFFFSYSPFPLVMKAQSPVNRESCLWCGPCVCAQARCDVLVCLPAKGRQLEWVSHALKHKEQSHVSYRIRWSHDMHGICVIWDEVKWSKHALKHPFWYEAMLSAWWLRCEMSTCNLNADFELFWGLLRNRPLCFKIGQFSRLRF